MFRQWQQIEESLLEDEDEQQDFSEVDFERLSHCLDGLREGDQQLIQQRYFEKVRVKQLASELDMTVNALSAKLFRLRGALKKCLELSHG